MKKRQYLPILLLAVFLLLCACAQNVTDQPETTPSSSSPVQLNSKPATKPTSTPTIIPTVVTQPTTAPTVPTTKPTAAPTKPTTPPPTTQPNLDWMTSREIVPFEDRFKEDVPFNVSPTYWMDAYEDMDGYGRYHFAIRSYGGSVPPVIIWTHSLEKDLMYYVPVESSRLDDFSVISADGKWAYLLSKDTLCKLELLTGELTTLATKGDGDLYWMVQACGVDTVCIFRVDAERNIRIFYRDLHSDAEKTLYEGVLPVSSPYDFITDDTRGLRFNAPKSTQGTFSWYMMNPDFYEAVQKELANPESPFRKTTQQNFSKCWENPEEYPIHASTYPSLCDRIQDAYDIPYFIKYICDPVSGVVTKDYGIIDTCFYGTGWGHNHFDYEITKNETPEILNETPKEIPDFVKPIGEIPEAESIDWFVYSDFGYGVPYFAINDPIRKLADIPVLEMVIGPDFVYCITPEGTIVQISYNGEICNAIYTSENKLYDLFYWNNGLYFIDGSTIIRIDTMAGTYQPILRTTLKEMYIIGEYEDRLYLGIRQGLYCQEYTFDVDAGILERESYI
ncbi:MAG: hypothetical protein E7447_06955 [Ruminococcaceae bacterium]|nr:hypothetical protein [Oscillospiraceae bacterium]